PLTQTSGRICSSSEHGEFSSKTATASTHSSASSKQRRSAAATTGRGGPFKRRTESSEFMQTTSVSPRERARLSRLTCPGWSRSKQPPAATTLPPQDRVRSTTSNTDGRLVAGQGLGESVTAQLAAPPLATNQLAWSTASTAADPSMRALTAVTEKLSPAPHTSDTAGTSGALTRSAPW